MISSGDLVAYVAAVHDRTREVVERFGDEHLGWRPAPEEFTVGELIKHIAASRRMNVGAILTGEVHYAGHEVPAGASAADLRDLLRRTETEVATGLAAADFERLIASASGAAPSPAWRRAVAGLIEHEVHHRSQLCSYLSSLGLPPPALYGLHTEALPR